MGFLNIGLKSFNEHLFFTMEYCFFDWFPGPGLPKNTKKLNGLFEPEILKKSWWGAAFYSQAPRRSLIELAWEHFGKVGHLLPSLIGQIDFQSLLIRSCILQPGSQTQPHRIGLGAFWKSLPPAPKPDWTNWFPKPPDMELHFAARLPDTAS